MPYYNAFVHAEMTVERLEILGGQWIIVWFVFVELSNI
jgi:hypothetical protein